MHQTAILEKIIYFNTVFCLSDIKISDFIDRGQLAKLNPLKPIIFFPPVKNMNGLRLQGF